MSYLTTVNFLPQVAPDGHLIFLILSSVASLSAYLSVLGRTARIFHDESTRDQVIAAASAEEVMELIRSHEPV